MGFTDIFELSKDMEMQAKKGSLDNFDGYIDDIQAQVNELAQ